MVDATSLPPTTSMEQRQNSPCHCFLNTLRNGIIKPRPTKNLPRRNGSVDDPDACHGCHVDQEDLLTTIAALTFDAIWKQFED
jgi:hypothetical protein